MVTGFELQHSSRSLATSVNQTVIMVFVCWDEGVEWGACVQSVGSQRLEKEVAGGASAPPSPGPARTKDDVRFRRRTLNGQPTPPHGEVRQRQQTDLSIRFLRKQHFSRQVTPALSPRNDPPLPARASSCSKTATTRRVCLHVISTHSPTAL